MESFTKFWSFAVLVSMVALLAGGCTSATAGLSSLPMFKTMEHKIEAGDKIRISIMDLQGGESEHMIDQTGTVSIPLLDRVAVAGLSLREAEDAIEKKLLDRRILVRPSVTVQALSLRPVYILGEVGKPGEYAYRDGLTVFSIVSLAGGFTYRADTKVVEITRTIDGGLVVGTGDENTIVMPGDQIRVLEKWF